jgi:hypothetical protein
MKYGSVAGFVVRNGYGPDGKNLRKEFEQWKDDEHR